MAVYLYDGSFEGWLCVLSEITQRNLEPVDITTEQNFNGDLFAQPIIIDTEVAVARRQWTQLVSDLNAEVRKQVHRVFLSELPGVEIKLCQFVSLLRRKGTGHWKDFSRPEVVWFHEVLKKMHREEHRMHAFTRFHLGADGLLAACIAPDFNVLPLIGDFFARRFADQQWLIFDERRQYGIFYNLANVSYISFPQRITSDHFTVSNLSADEQSFQHLWHTYFKNVNIQARKNMKLHIRHVPRRYWRYLSEKLPDSM